MACRVTRDQMISGSVVLPVQQGKPYCEAPRWCRVPAMSARRDRRRKPQRTQTNERPDSDVWPFFVFVRCVEVFSTRAVFCPVCRAQLA